MSPEVMFIALIVALPCIGMVAVILMGEHSSTRRDRARQLRVKNVYLDELRDFAPERAEALRLEHDPGIGERWPIPRRPR